MTPALSWRWYRKVGKTPHRRVGSRPPVPPFLGELGNSRIHRQRDKFLVPKGRTEVNFKRKHVADWRTILTWKSITMATATESKQKMRKAVPERKWRVNKETPLWTPRKRSGLQQFVMCWRVVSGSLQSNTFAICHRLEVVFSGALLLGSFSIPSLVRQAVHRHDWRPWWFNQIYPEYSTEGIDELLTGSLVSLTLPLTMLTNYLLEIQIQVSTGLMRTGSWSGTCALEPNCLGSTPDLLHTSYQIRKGVCQGCILSPCFFNFYVEYIMRNARLEEAQAGIKIARRNINNLRYADVTTLTAKREEELESLLMKVKEEVKKLA